MTHLVVGDTYAATLKIQALRAKNYTVVWLVEGSLTQSRLLLDRLKSIKIRLLSPQEELIKIYQYYIGTGYNGDINSCYIPLNLLMSDKKIDDQVKIYTHCTQIKINDNMVNFFSAGQAYSENFAKMVSCDPIFSLAPGPSIELVPAFYRSVIPVPQGPKEPQGPVLIKKYNFIMLIYETEIDHSIIDENDHKKADLGKTFLIIEALSLDNLQQRRFLSQNNEIEIILNSDNVEKAFLAKFHKIVTLIHNKRPGVSPGVGVVPGSQFFNIDICDQGTCINHANITTTFHRQSALELFLLYHKSQF